MKKIMRDSRRDWRRYWLPLLALLLLACTEPQGEVITLYVAPNTVACEGVSTQQCLLVKQNPTQDWARLYQPIEGFDFEPGRAYELRVEQIPVPNPPADGPDVELRLVEVVSQLETDIVVSLEGEEAEPTPTLAAESPDASATPEPTVAPPDTVESDLPLGLVGQPWYLQAIDEAAAVPETEAQIRFNADGTAVGSGGCNTYFADYEAAADGTLSLGPIASTKTACISDELTNQETTFFEALAEAVGYEVDAETLRIFFGDGRILTFALVPPQAPVGFDLTKTTWYLQSLGENTAMLPGTAITLDFAFGDTLSGVAGCNDYSGGYAISEEGQIRFSGVAATAKMCPQPIIDQELAYLGALAKVTRYALAEDGMLTLTDEGGSTVLTFAATPPESAASSPPINDIAFAAGENSLTVEGSTLADAPVAYILPLNEGDKLVVRLETDAPGAALAVEGVDDGVVYLDAAASATTFIGVLPTTQPYRITVFPSETTSFTLSISRK